MNRTGSKTGNVIICLFVLALLDQNCDASSEQCTLRRILKSWSILKTCHHYGEKSQNCITWSVSEAGSRTCGLQMCFIWPTWNFFLEIWISTRCFKMNRCFIKYRILALLLYSYTETNHKSVWSYLCTPLLPLHSFALNSWSIC